MVETLREFDGSLPLDAIRQAAVPSVADQVFEELQRRILTLELPPRTKISETEVSRKMGVSRQPVREAFKRLAKLGFLLIRPQSGTTVSLISEKAVLRARFIRTALEVKTCRTACETLSAEGLAALAAIIERQREAIEVDNRNLFHALDEEFHREICTRSGVAYVWDLIHESKAHMDRIRMLSLSSSSQRYALIEHIALYDAIAAKQPDVAEKAMTDHLSRILVLIDEVKALDHSWFTDSESTDYR